MLKFRREEQEVETMPPLKLEKQDGTPWVTYPTDVVDSLRHLLSRLMSRETLPVRLSLVAALRQEGNTYISRALGTVMAHDLETTVCVVELNWWWPSEIPDGPDDHDGLAAVLNDQISIDEALMETTYPNLSILPAGNLPLEQRAVIARSSTLEKVIDDLSVRFDHLILDVPAVLATNDAIPLASYGTATCLVVRQGVTSVDSVRRALDDIEHLHMLGTVMNQTNIATPDFLHRLIPQY